MRRWRGLIAAHADDLEHRAQDAARRELLPLLAACRWHERYAARALTPKRAPGRPVWLAGVRAVEHRAPLGQVRIAARADAPILGLGIDFLQSVVSGNRVRIDLSPRSARAQALLVELARAAWESLFNAPPPWHVGEANRDIIEALRAGERPDALLLWAREQERAAARVWAQSEGVDLRARRPVQAIGLVLPGADLPGAAGAIWASATDRHIGLRVAPRRVLVDESMAERFARELRPRAASARPIRSPSREEADRAYALARTALGYGARSASGVVESPTSGPPAFRPQVMLDCPAEIELAIDPAGVIPVTSVVSLDEAAGLIASEPVRCSLAVFGGSRAQRRTLLDIAPWGGVCFDRWPISLIHPGLTTITDDEGSGRDISVGGPEGLLSLTRRVTVSSGGEAGRGRSPAGGWIARLYRAPTGDAEPDLSIRAGKIRGKPQRTRQRRGPKQRA